MTVPQLSGPPAPVADLADVATVRTADGITELFGSRCPRCGTEAFPARQHCRVCFADGQGELGLGRYGTLYSFTVVQVSSSRQTPYAIGYVDLAGGIRVLSDLDLEHDDLACDVPVELESDDNGWRFRVIATTGTTEENADV